MNAFTERPTETILAWQLRVSIEIERLKAVIRTQRLEIDLLRDGRLAFDLSADGRAGKWQAG